MFVFVHLHKCAGTSVIEAAQAAGLKFPDRHANGNPFDGGIMVDYFSKMTIASFMRFMKRMKREGVEFFAMEWDMPRIPAMQLACQELGAKFFTILRDPLDRAISNMRMDAANGWGTPFADLESYLDGSATYRNDNYYTKFLSGNAYKRRATLSDLGRALSIIGSMIEYSFMGDDLVRFLTERVKLPIAGLGLANAARNTKAIAEYSGPVRFEPTPAECVGFYARNAIDYALCGILRRRLAPEESLPTSLENSTASPGKISALRELA